MRFWRQFRCYPHGMVGLAIWIVALVLTVVGPQLVPLAPNEQHLLLQFKPPLSTADGMRFWLGSDQFGRDVLSRLLAGSAVSIGAALAAVGMGALLGTLLGLVSGFYGGILDAIVMRIGDIQLSLPPFLLAIALAAVTGPGLWNVIFIIGVTSWVPSARVVRSKMVVTKNLDFVESARAIGANDFRILSRYLLPAALPAALVMAAVLVGRAMILEATLSFLGVGVPISMPTWGGMLNEGKGYMHVAWWITSFPGLAITLMVLATNYLGDVIGEVLDPSSRPPSS